MKTDEKVFSDEYEGDSTNSGTKYAARISSQTEAEITGERYKSSKPRRIIIRAEIIAD